MARSEIAPRCIAETNVLHESPHDIFKIASKYASFWDGDRQKDGVDLPIFLLDQEVSTILCNLTLFISILC